MARGIRSTRREVPMAKTLVIYNVDTGTSYQEKVTHKKSVLSPTTFTPTKSGYTFTGWRLDNTASSSVLVNCIAEGKVMYLYAVFQKNITVTYYNNSSSASSSTKQQYYNNSNVNNPTFNLTVATVSGWNIRGWSTSSSSSGTISYNSGANFTRSSNVTLYASWSKSVTVTYYNNSKSASTTSGTAYRGYKGDVAGASFKLAQASKSSFTARGWTTSNNGGESSIAYNNNTTFTRDSNVTLYGCYYRTVTLTYSGNGATGGSTSSQTGTAYYHSVSEFTSNTSGTTIPKFTISSCGYSKSSYSFVWWNEKSDDTGSKHTVGSQVRWTDALDHTIYAIWVVSSTTFNYTGGMQSFSARAGIQYKIEIFGAQGGSYGGSGGKGGYTIGYRTPSNNETWYIGVGGSGSHSPWDGTANGGYNGGGKGYSGYDHLGNEVDACSGGGASHVGLSNATLAGTSSSNLIGAAGGGGGGMKVITTDGNTNNWFGGDGGGTSGANGANSSTYGGGGGTQYGPGSGGIAPGQTAAGYGQGGDGNHSSGHGASGGGSGYYGGGGSNGSDGGGGGGSAYTGGMYSASTSAGQRSGNGQVIITVA